jgi:4-hydroxybenzoate polyprenyltransferase
MTWSRGYVELIRPANVATALADVLAGYAIAGLANHVAVPWLLLATACLYAGGVVLNDVFDRDLDRTERPERPIPSGRVSVSAAAWLGGGLLTLGVLAATAATATAGAIAIAIVACILLYDSWGKRHDVIGPLSMGACRALNLLLGVAAVPSALGLAHFVILLPWTYITAVTALSRGEVHGGRRSVAAFALLSLSAVLVALLALSASGASFSSAGSWAGIVLTGVLGWRVLPSFIAAYRNPGAATIRQAIKSGVLSLMFVDAVIGAVYAGALYSVLILVVAVVAGRLARLFPVT